MISNPRHPRFTDSIVRIHMHQRTFLQYLDDFSVVDDEQKLFQQLADCHDVVPWDAARDLGLPPGATYTDAVDLLRSDWQLR